MGLLDFLRSPVRALNEWSPDLALDRIDLPALVADLKVTGLDDFDRIVAEWTSDDGLRISHEVMFPRIKAAIDALPVAERARFFGRVMLVRSAAVHLVHIAGQHFMDNPWRNWRNALTYAATVVSQSGVTLDDGATDEAARAVRFLLPAALARHDMSQAVTAAEQFVRVLPERLSRAQRASVAAAANALDRAAWAAAELKWIEGPVAALFERLEQPKSDSHVVSRTAGLRATADRAMAYVSDGLSAPLRAYMDAMVVPSHTAVPYAERPGIAAMQALDPAATATLLVEILTAWQRAQALCENKVSGFPPSPDWMHFLQIGRLVQHDSALPELMKNHVRRKVIATDAEAAHLLSSMRTWPVLQDLRVLKIVEATLVAGSAPKTRAAAEALLKWFEQETGAWRHTPRLSSLRSQATDRLKAVLDGPAAAGAEAQTADKSVDPPLPPRPVFEEGAYMFSRLDDYYGDLADLRKCTEADLAFLGSFTLWYRDNHRTGYLERVGKAATLPAEFHAAWRRLHAVSAILEGKSKPADKWFASARGALDGLGGGQRLDLLDRMLDILTPIVGTATLSDNAARGLIYLAKDWPADAAGPILTRHALKTFFQSVPGVGIRGERLGNACLWTLIQMPNGGGVPYLARLLARVKYPKVKKKIDQALNEAAAKAGLTRAALDELTVPTHELQADGTLSVHMGACAAVVAVTGPRDVSLTWRDSQGRSVKSIPAAIKDMKAEIKSVRDLVKEIDADLSLQNHRLQRLFLEDRRWPVATWGERYIAHPLVGPSATTLIWNVHRGETRTAIVWRQSRAEDVAGAPVEIAPGDEISLWHPVLCPVKEVLAWRERLAEIGLRQPFKQAHREVYLVTDAEKRTGTYSNRFAGHILKQHQMMSLARLNGWTVTHRIWADVPNDEPTHLMIPAYGLVASYWTEGAGGDSPDVTDSQAYVYIATDQVRFHKLAADAAPATAKGPLTGDAVAMTDVPPIVFSEIMRHCDLFVGVASIANDPLWADSGRDAEHPNQWRRAAAEYAQRQAFSDLTATGETRRRLLELILPRLAINDRCRIDGRFLCVKGHVRSYKIHLGSGNILMEPNDQYLCIVPDRSKTATGEDAVLPFEGDPVFSIILSKAMLLAADHTITDPTILSQLART